MIIHLDIDAFYASVAQRNSPELRGIPLAVSGRSRRSVVLTASYEARPFGVRSAMPLYRALELCPHLTVVAPDFESYREASMRVFEIFASGGHEVEGLSLDEAFIGLPDATVDEAVALAVDVRARIRNDVGLTASAGIGTVKMVAKIASDLQKPDGLTVVEPGTERAFLAPLDIGKIWGIGPKTRPRLEAAGLRTIGDVAALEDTVLYEVFGRSGPYFRDLARGVDERVVDGSRERKSISSEETFEYDVRDESEILALLRVQANELAEGLQQRTLRASTVGIKAKRSDFVIIARQTTLAVASDDADTILAAAIACWQRADLAGIPIRLLGTRVAALTSEESRELRLF